MKTRITFFITDLIEKLTFDAIKNEAERRGHETSFSYNLSEQAQIGFYCCHVPMIKEVNAEFSVIMLHDLGQGQERWPNFWHCEPWERFDLGLLPGPAWQSMYELSAANSKFQGPLLGVYTLGWPKSDRIFEQNNNFHKEVEQARKDLNLLEGQTVLYAPSWENDGKQDDFIESCLDLGCNLLVKQAPWPDSHPDIVKNIEQMEKKYRGYHQRLYLADKTLDIMIALALSDLLVTDESCVMFEALLFNIPSISVHDWLIPDRNPARYSCAPHDFVIQSTRKRLREDISSILTPQREAGQKGEKLLSYREQWFSHLGRSAKSCVDLVEWLYHSTPHRTALEKNKLSLRLNKTEAKLLETQATVKSLSESLGLAQQTLDEYKKFIDCVNKSRVWRYTRPVHRTIEQIRSVLAKK